MRYFQSLLRLLPVVVAAVSLHASAAYAQQMGHRTSASQGVKANTGFATHTTENGMSVLTLSDDFKIPEAPAPHWQVVDSKGNLYLLQMLKIKGDKFNKRIVVPSYVADVAKVQIWCSWAEALLGEASFESPVM